MTLGKQAPIKTSLILTFCTLFSCTHSPKEIQIENNKPIQTTPISGPPAAAQIDTPQISKSELLLYTLRLSSPENAFTKEDMVFLENIQKIPSNTFSQAASVVGTLRKVASSSDPDAAASPDWSLEEELNPYGIDLSAALSQNVALKNHLVYGFALKALENSTDTDAYKSQITGIIYKEAQSWAALLPKNTENESLVEESLAEDEEEKMPLPLSAEDLRRGDSLMTQAQILADQGRFKKAIDTVSGIKEADPLFLSAKEKIKGFSNLAVQRLRQQAAQAFQDAMPATDPETKSKHLEKAKQYLEKALKDFPNSDQLATVSENLVVIALDLEKIRKEEPKPEDIEKALDKAKVQKQGESSDIYE